MNDLEKYFINNTKRKIHKHDIYFDVYDKHFSRFRNTEVNVLEIGVAEGGSLQMWKDYFGSKANIYGIDIQPGCKNYEEDRIKIFIGDQEDKAFLSSVVRSIPRLDIVIDDGGHLQTQLISTFEALYPHIDINGIYLAEDLCCCYWKHYGGGYKRERTFIEYSKNLIDKINAWTSEDPKLRVDHFSTITESIHFYTSMLIIEKGFRKPWKEVSSGGVDV
jgi:hypothetical protein